MLALQRDKPDLARAGFMYQNSLEQEPKIYLHENQLQVFDILASVDMARFDLDERGYIAPETKQRILDEELTLIVEGVDRPHRTTFVIKNINGQLSYFDQGQWRPYISLLYKGFMAAEQLASSDYHYDFQAQRASDELKEGYAMQGLEPGQSLVVCRRYPKNVELMFGKKILEDIGYQPDRQMGFISLATKQLNGDVVLISQSVDNSNEDAFKLVEQAAEDGIYDIDILLNIYDEVLSSVLSQSCRAGRLPIKQHEDAWNLLQTNQDLAEFLFTEIEKLALSLLPRSELLDAKKRLTYGVWAAFKKRLDYSNVTHGNAQFGYEQSKKLHSLINAHQHHNQLDMEVRVAFQEASAKGEVLLACGGSIGGIMDANTNDVRDMIFGGKSERGEDKFGSLTFKCPRGHTNTRPRNQLIEKCRTCQVSVKC